MEKNHLPAATAEAAQKGAWDVYMPRTRRAYTTVYSAAEAKSYEQNGYRVVKQKSTQTVVTK